MTTTLVEAQLDSDIFRFSELQFGQSARSTATGGAFGALGADFGSLSVNPAGLALYRATEISVTPGLNYRSIGGEIDFGDGTYPTANYNQFRPSLNHLGAAITSIPYSPNVKRLNFAIGINHHNGYYKKSGFNGNTLGSITQRFTENGNVSWPELSVFEEDLAFDIDLIYFDPTLVDTPLVSDIAETDQTFKEQEIVEKGSIDEVIMAAGVNLNDKYYFGASIGIPLLSYEVRKTYAETDLDNSIPFFENLSFDELIKTNGLGINMKLGAIYRASPKVRVGVSIHSPTILLLNDTFRNVLSARIVYGDSTTNNPSVGSSPLGVSDYTMITPWRFTISGAYILRGLGFISADLEAITNGSARLRFENDDEYEEQVNALVSDKYKTRINARVGAEFAKGDLRFRVGGSYSPSPISSTYRITPNSNFGLSTGFGFRKPTYFIDLAYSYKRQYTEYQPYSVPSNINPVNVGFKHTYHQVLLTLGLRLLNLKTTQ